ncbi:hypothetical protein FHS88_001753 [Roseomonas alkaliterrae]|uniref:Uncharacterized protein n=1 Tax=Neoroseomonas alkaliterrae TaxID=1452450 RepID=A0A840XM40_9PROT|nr:hypothetical protein [Neoroseomonas alkaliterrae]MBB5689628.1 hypothetical protein [Neoroseomonas alkaliterrae]
MSAEPPPGAVVLLISGVRGGMDRVAVEEAIRRFDPAARIWTNWPKGMVAVETAAPAEALRMAVQDAGYVAGLRQGGAAAREPVDIAAAVMRVIGLTFAGFVLGTLLGAALGVGNALLNPLCATPGDSGGCAMGIPSVALAAGSLGAPLGFALALWRALRR